MLVGTLLDLLVTIPTQIEQLWATKSVKIIINRQVLSCISVRIATGVELTKSSTLRVGILLKT